MNIDHSIKNGPFGAACIHNDAFYCLLKFTRAKQPQWCVFHLCFIWVNFSRGRRSRAPATLTSVLVSPGIQMRTRPDRDELRGFHRNEVEKSPGSRAGQAGRCWPLNTIRHEGPDGPQTCDSCLDRSLRIDTVCKAERTSGWGPFPLNLWLSPCLTETKDNSNVILYFSICLWFELSCFFKASQ